MLEMKNITKTICDGVVKNEVLMERLRASAFDLFLADPLFPSGELIAEKLGIPFVYTFRFSMGNTVERLCGKLPAPPSYVPSTLSSLTDRMTFWQRLKNILGYTLQDFAFHYLLWANWNQYYSEVLGKAALFPEITSAVHTRINSQRWEVKAQIRSKTIPNSPSFLQNSFIQSSNPGKYKHWSAAVVELSLYKYFQDM